MLGPLKECKCIGYTVSSKVFCVEYYTLTRYCRHYLPMRQKCNLSEKVFVVEAREVVGRKHYLVRHSY